MIEKGLTGRIRYRRGWRNKLVLQVEYEYWDGGTYLGWRDARVEDLNGTLLLKTLPLK